VAERFASFREFYRFYLTEHANRTCRRLHFVGNTLVIACLAALALTRNPWWLLAALLCGYGFAWVGCISSSSTTVPRRSATRSGASWATG